MTKTSKLLLGTVVLISTACTAQTVNEGELLIKPRTIVSIVEGFDNATTGELTNDGELYLFSHYNNDGLVTFTKGGKTGTTFMKGTKGYQGIFGSVPMEWNNVEFANTAVQPAFRLANEIRISGMATFQNGIVNSNDYDGLMVFEDGSTQEGATDVSYVDGQVRKNGRNPFVYPIGAGGYYRNARISAPQKSEAVFSGFFFLKDSSFLYPHSSKEANISVIDNTEYWTLDKTAGDDNVFLTLSWNEDTTASTVYGLPYDEIHIVHWDTAQSKWVDLGGAVNNASKEVTMIVNPLKSYGVFTLARVKTAPSDLVVYNAVSPNEDGMNDFFKIDGIENYKNNNVEIYNRWGVKVFEASGYDNVTNVFKGISEGHATISKSDKLPVGAYFYIINAEIGTGKSFKKSGYLYLNY